MSLEILCAKILSSGIESFDLMACGGLYWKSSFLFAFDKMGEKSTTKFLLHKFDGGNFFM